MKRLYSITMMASALYLEQGSRGEKKNPDFYCRM